MRKATIPILLLIAVSLALAGCPAGTEPLPPAPATATLPPPGPTMPLPTDAPEETAVPAPMDAASGEEAQIRSVIETYFYLRHKLVSVVTDEPFPTASADMQALCAYCCGAEFINRVSITQQMRYEHLQAQNLDLSYASFTMRPIWGETTVGEDTASVRVVDEVRICWAFDPETESIAGEEHRIELRKIDGRWRISDDVRSDEFDNYTARYRYYKAQSPYGDLVQTNQYILEEYRKEVARGLQG